MVPVSMVSLVSRLTTLIWKLSFWNGDAMSGRHPARNPRKTHLVACNEWSREGPVRQYGLTSISVGSDCSVDNVESCDRTSLSPTVLHQVDKGHRKEKGVLHGGERAMIVYVLNRCL